jgi:YidC/Oxa1 family membrane protein insertase
MPPQTNTRNLLVFMVLSSLIFAGSIWLQNWLMPPKPHQASEPTLSRADAHAWSELAVRAPASAVLPGVPGLGTAAQIYADTTLARWLAAREYRLPVVRRPEPKAEPPAPAVAAKPAAPRKAIPIGHDDGFKIRAVLTTHGAGVQSLVLTQFQAANRLGRPAGTELELIPEEANYDTPSNLLYHYANVDDDRPVETLGTTEWEVVRIDNAKGKDRHEVVFAADVPGQDLRITKTFSLARGEYHVGLEVKVERKGTGKGPIAFRYQLTGGHGLPIEGEWYTSTFTNALFGGFGQRNTFWRDFQDARSIGLKSGGERVVKGPEQRITYAAVAIQYFASVIAVADPQQDFLAWARPTVEAVRDPRKPFLDSITVRVVTQPAELKAGDKPLVHKYVLYNGPVKVRLLDDPGSGEEAVSAELVHYYADVLHLDTLTDWHMPTWISEHIFSPIGWSYLLIKITNLMHGVLGWLYQYIPNYGICIILLTVLVRGLMHPVSRKQARTSIKMQALVPELKKLQEKHKNDRQAMAMAQMELYRKHGVSPIGSCWVVFLQMPVFLGLYYALQESIHFRLAPFLWIQNLAAPDMLIWWGENIPWISRPEDQGSFLYLGPFFNLLPVVAVALMIVQQKFLMPPPTDEQQEMQQKMMKYMMIFFGLMFYKVAAGLCIYFIASSLWGLAERKMLPKAKTAVVPSGATGGPGGPGRPAPVRGRTRGPKAPEANGRMQKVRDMWDELLKQAKKK